MLSIDPPATAGGTDSVQERFQTLRQSPQHGWRSTMNTEQQIMEHGPTLRGFSRRKVVSVTANSLVQRRYLAGAEGFPLVLEPVVKGVDAAEWGRNERERLL